MKIVNLDMGRGRGGETVHLLGWQQKVLVESYQCGIQQVNKSPLMIFLTLNSGLSNLVSFSRGSETQEN